MRTLLIIFTFSLLLVNCSSSHDKIKLISPVENYNIIKADNLIYDKTDHPDFINKIKASFYFEEQYFVASDRESVDNYAYKFA